MAEIENDIQLLKGNKCIIGVFDDEVGNKHLTVKNDSDEVIYYAFSSEKGLCITTEYGSVRRENLLQEMISLPDGNIGHLFSYIEETGFFLPLASMEDYEISYEAIIDTVRAIKATTLLLSEIAKVNPNYEKILHLTFYLILGKREGLRLNENVIRQPCEHGVIKILKDTTLLPISNADALEANEKGCYIISDTMHKSAYKLDAGEYADIICGERFSFDYPGIDDKRYKKLIYRYKNRVGLGQNERIVVDFLFHFMHSVGVVKSVSYCDGISYYGKPKMDKMDNNMKAGLLNTARIVTAEEINYNISLISPIYSPRKLEPVWHFPDLLSAYFFSIFYMRPGREMYRKCANPSCGKYFLVKTTNGRKKYCGDNCRNANNQRDHRLREKKKKAKPQA